MCASTDPCCTYHLSAALMINMPIKLTALSNVSLLMEQRGHFFTESGDGWYSPLPYIAAGTPSHIAAGGQHAAV